MFKNKNSHMGGCIDGVKVQLGYVETDPSGRYGRFREILGKGAMKTVYKAFDEILAMEVAWNQVILNEVFHSPIELERLYCEVHLLKNLNHDSIIKFSASWIDVDRRTFNFITEMFTSGTLREYRQKYQLADIRAVKNWAQQILRGLAYLHGHDPPVIHRDLKCDNIFVNGHLGQVKIGDLGLAAILHGTQHAHSVIGTPEFMAPELYEENYNELVDIYSFGMCVLEMLTCEYPYSECSNPAQIYKKVTSGKLPEAFYRIQDAKARHFVGKCLENVSKRMPAKELLLEPFLACDEEKLLPIPELPNRKLIPDGKVLEPVPPSAVDTDEGRSTHMTITGSINPEDDTIFLKVQISDKDGHTRNIYFPFDILNDTATDVAMEMVIELEIIDWEPLEIAEMIEEEISSLVPNWKYCVSSPHFRNQHAVSYREEEYDDSNNGIHHPFYHNSSHSSSHASLPAFMNLVNAEDLLGNDDLSSNGSVSSSFKYSTMDYTSGNEVDHDLTFRGRDSLYNSRTIRNKSTRFCPTYCNDENVNSKRACGSDQLRKISRIRSLVDVRSQLLHKSLVAEINKRRLFKTVGAVENIGFHEPGNHVSYGRCSNFRS